MKDTKITFEAPTPDMYLTNHIHQGQLPPFLEEAVTITDQTHLQDMLLLSVLTACSYALPHIKMLHGDPQHTYYPNLMTLIVAPPASGKGVMNNVRMLIDPIHRKLSAEKKFARIPANSSSTTFLDILRVSGGKGFMMETEMDILAKTWKKDYADFSDLFRQAFEHEPFCKARRVGMRKTKALEITNPKLSVLLSGTPNQVIPLLGTGEDGLASRFLPYLVSDIMPFNPNVLLNGDHFVENGAHAVYERLGQELLARYDWLANLDQDILWSLTDKQAQILGMLLSDAFTLSFEKILNRQTNETFQMPDSFVPSFNRMVVTIKRIGLILSALRLDIHSTRKAEEVLYCSDTDFRTMVLLAEKLLRHAAELIIMLPASKSPIQLNRIESHAALKAQDLLAQLPERFGYADVRELGEKENIPKITMKRRVDSLLQDKLIVKISRGKYRKV